MEKIVFESRLQTRRFTMLPISESLPKTKVPMSPKRLKVYRDGIEFAEAAEMAKQQRRQ